MSARVEQVVAVLRASGWHDDGRTQSEAVLVPTQRSPRFGKTGGELRTFGGRLRFARGDRRVSVGPRIVCFYRIVDREAHDFARVATSDLKTIWERARDAQVAP